ncbi:MAG: thiamine phosphate synthase [Isosphaeraceae bacterium]
MDYARFVLDDPGLTRRPGGAAPAGPGPRQVRPRPVHRLTRHAGDVGTHIDADRTDRRAPAVLTANFKRTAEASVARGVREARRRLARGPLRGLAHDVYTLEKLVNTAATSSESLGSSRLMVLVGNLPTLGDLTWVVGEALEGGADVIQLREKEVPDRVWLQRAREVRILTARARAWRGERLADLARLAGRTPCTWGRTTSPCATRRVVGPRMTVGVSTHTAAELDAAVLAGAGYLGVGPVFTSLRRNSKRARGPQPRGLRRVLDESALVRHRRHQL